MNENIHRGLKWFQDHAYILNQRIPDTVICHHGIPGQKWVCEMDRLIRLTNP